VAPQNNRLKSLSIANPIELKHTPDLFIPPSNQGKGNKGVGKPPWKRTFAYLIGQKPGSGADLDLIGMSTRKDSRFLFNMTVDGKPVSGLVDSGCTTVAIAADFVRKHKIRTTPTSSPINLRYGNGTQGVATQQVTLNVTRNNYKQDMVFLVLPIKHDLILGTLWFESIQITNLDWHARVFEFTDTNNLKHAWSKMAKPKIEQIIHCTMAELQRDTK
jgi:hypothetical protein